jgi:hypothetical protein
MIGWLKKIFKKNKPLPLYHTCDKCVYWKSEEENNIIPEWNNNKKRYCDVYKYSTKYNHTCALYTEEKFEATDDSIQTKELNLDYNLSIEESELIDPRAKEKES